METLPIRKLIEQAQVRGFPHAGFGDFAPPARVFHLPFPVIEEFVHGGEQVALFDELEQAVFPFDVFELLLHDAPTLSFTDQGGWARYRPLRYLLAVDRADESVTFLVADDLEMIGKSGESTRHASAFLFTIDERSEEKLIRQPILPKGGTELSRTILLEEELQNAYWLRILIAFIRFSITLNHRGVAIERIDDPLRPPYRQQRRASRYIDQEHYRIAIRARLTADAAMRDALSGRMLRFTPRRRHEVSEFVRTYASGKTGAVRAHLRGGKLAPGPDYDARAAILSAIRDIRGEQAITPP